MLAPTARAAKTTKRTPAPSDELRDGLLGLRPELLGRALRLARSRDAAEDLVQDTLERALRFQSTYKRGSNLRAWVHQIMFSVFMTRCRRSRLERDGIAELSADPCAWTLKEPAPAMLRLSPPVERALKNLPRGYRRVLVLVDIQEVSYRAAARELRVPMGTVMSRLFRGRRALAEAITAPRVLRQAA